MSFQVEPSKPLKPENGVIRLLLDFDSSDEDFDYDKNLDQIKILNNTTNDTGNQEPDGRKQSDFSFTGSSRLPPPSLVFTEGRPQEQEFEKQSFGNKDQKKLSNQNHHGPSSIMKDDDNSNGHTHDGDSIAVSPSSAGNNMSFNIARAHNHLLKVPSDNSTSSMHLSNRFDDKLVLSDSKKNKAYDSLPNSPKKKRGNLFDPTAIVDLTLSDDEDDNRVSRTANGDNNRNKIIPESRNVQHSSNQPSQLSRINTLGNSVRKNDTNLPKRQDLPLTISNNGNQKPLINNGRTEEQHEVIDLSDFSSTEDDDDDDDVQIIDVSSIPQTNQANVRNGQSTAQSTNNSYTQFLNDQRQIEPLGGQSAYASGNHSHARVYSLDDDARLAMRIFTLEHDVEQLKELYNKQAQKLIENKSKQRKIAEAITNLKSADAVLSQRNDPVSLSLIPGGRLKIQQYSIAYNTLVKDTLNLEKSNEEKRRLFLSSKMRLAEMKQERAMRLTFPAQRRPYNHVTPLDFEQETMDYNTAYQNAIMSQPNNLMSSRGYSSNIYTDDSTSLQSLLNNIKPDETYVEGQAKTPEGLGVSLLVHQRIGLAWLMAMEASSNKGGILADDMGLGKTVQTLALMLQNRSTDSNCKTDLIVAPIALLKQWEQEIISKLKPQFSLRVFIYHSQDKLRTFQEMKKYDVVLVSYNTLASEMKKHYALAIEEARVAKQSSIVPQRDSGGQKYRSPFFTNDLKFYRIILDEAQWVKNKLTQLSKSVALLEGKYRWCLSGTPMQNSVDELYSLIRFLRIRPYNDEHRFKSDISLPMKNNDRYDSLDTSRAMKKLQLLLKAILLRRTKDSEIDGKPILQLPEKKVRKEDVEMLEIERKYYSSLEQHSAREADSIMKQRQRGNYSSILTLLLRLRQLCCHKYLVEMGDRKSSGYDATKVPPKIIRELAPNVISRISREADSGFTCPICFDSISNERVAILSPCGHALCQDCISQFFDQFQTNNSDDESRIATCMTCRGTVKEKDVFKYETFDMIHNKNFTDEQVRLQFTHDFTSDKKTDRRKNLLRLIEEDGGFKSSLKIDLCISTIEKILSSNADEKIIVFSQFTLLFEIIKIVLDSKSISYLQYDGSMNSEERNRTIGLFYRETSKRVLLLSLKAGNVGLTLTCANHVIIMDPFWNPFVEEQAMDRAHRIGQQREVHVHKLLIKGTIEDRILQLQEKKKELINGALDSEGMSTISRLGRNEIRFLFGLADGPS